MWDKINFYNMDKKRLNIFLFIVICCVMIFYGIHTSQLVCDSNTCYIKEYNTVNQVIKKRTISLDDISYFESKHKRPFLSKHSAYFIYAVNKKGQKKQFFKNGTRYYKNCENTITALNKILEMEDKSMVNIFYPYSMNTKK